MFRRPAKLQRPDLLPPGTRTLNIVDVGAHLLDPTLSPPIKALFVYNHNPLVVHPDQNRMRRGLSREDLFVVGCDVVMTDSLAYADVVLPASIPSRRRIYSAYCALAAARRPVIRPARLLPTPRSSRRLAAASASPPDLRRTTPLMDDAVDGASSPGACPEPAAHLPRHRVIVGLEPPSSSKRPSRPVRQV